MPVKDSIEYCEPTHRVFDVSQHLGITMRQMQWWNHCKFVTSELVGHVRFYSTQKVAQLAIAKEIRRTGISLQAIKKIGWVKIMREVDGWLSGSESRNAYMMLSRPRGTKKVYMQFLPDGPELLAAAAKSKTPVSVVNLYECVRKARLMDRESVPPGINHPLSDSTTRGKQTWLGA